MARGIAIGVNGKEDYTGVVMGFHPSGGGTSSRWFHEDPWLTVNMQQTGHGLAADVRVWERIANDYNRTPVKPVMDAEPLYEDHPLAFRAKDNGYSFDAHVRQRAYWDVFSGAFGHTTATTPSGRCTRPNASQLMDRYLLDAGCPPSGRDADAVPARADRIAALLSAGCRINRLWPMRWKAPTTSPPRAAMAMLFVYSAQGRTFTVNMGKISGDRVKGWWYSPRGGYSMEAGTLDNRGTRDFEPPSQGFGSDWVLVLDDADRNFAAPGK